MINVFHGTDKKTHNAFQAWRRTHVDGFHMTERSGGVFTIHWAQDKRENDAGRGCAHQGGSSNGYRYDGNSCYTTARKVCSDSIAELRAWAEQHDYVTKSCSHCDKGDFRFPEEGENPDPAEHAQTLPEDFVSTDGSGLEHARSVPAYLFLWNPRQDSASFRDFDQVCADAATGRPYEARWICPSRKPQPGDIALLQRTGKEHNGVFARGVITRGAYEHRGVQVVNLRLDSFLPLGEELSRAKIIATAKYEQPWMPMASGNVIPGSLLEAILKLWKRPSEPPAVEGSADDDDAAAAARADELEALEGERRQQIVRHRKREAALRSAKVTDALSRHGRLACEVPGCGFDFAQTYGSVGSGYAHVHHLQPLASREKPQRTRLSELAIVCANCHAMIHRSGGCRDMASLLAR